ncbi:MAG: hypothetical protein WC326_09205 [Candidatus Delongbacteria bacterium]
MSDELTPTPTPDEFHEPEAFESGAEPLPEPMEEPTETDPAAEPQAADLPVAEAEEPGQAGDGPAPAPERPAAPVRRSFGRIRRIEEDGTAWVADFHPLGRDVLVRLRSAFVANPGHILEYELKSGGPGRWSGVDVVFNRPPELAAVLALDEGRGLSPEGLEWVKRAIVQDPALLKTVFGGTRQVGRQLIEDMSFPLPRALLTAALKVPALAAAAARRLQGGPLRDAAEWTALILAAPPRDEEAWLRRLSGQHAAWLLEDLPLPAEGRRERVLRWWRRTGDPRWLLQLAGDELPAEAALPLLARGVLGGNEALEPAEQAAWARLLDAPTRLRLLAAAFRDPARRGDTACFAAAGPEFRGVLTGLATDPILGAEARALLLERGELSPAAALDLLRKDARGEARERLLAILLAAAPGERPEPGPELALEWFRAGAVAADPALLEWLGAHPAVQEQVEGWLADEATRELGLLALCHGREFSRARVQKLLGLSMSESTRRRLVEAIGRVSPERWQERYLLNDEEKASWLAAGAPLH